MTPAALPAILSSAWMAGHLALIDLPKMGA